MFFKTAILFLALAVSYSSADFTVQPDWLSVRSTIDTSFSCEGKHYGYYSDVNNGCQLYHVCNPRVENGQTIYEHNPFLCSAGTVFDQKLLTCVHQSPEFVCGDQVNHYHVQPEHVVSISEQAVSKPAEESAEVVSAPVAEPQQPVAEPQQPVAEPQQPETPQQTVVPAKGGQEPVKQEPTKQVQQQEQQPIKQQPTKQVQQQEQQPIKQQPTKQVQQQEQQPIKQQPTKQVQQQEQQPIKQQEPTKQVQQQEQQPIKQQEQQPIKQQPTKQVQQQEQQPIKQQEPTKQVQQEQPSKGGPVKGPSKSIKQRIYRPYPVGIFRRYRH